jgi:hypothetical protein
MAQDFGSTILGTLGMIQRNRQFRQQQELDRDKFNFLQDQTRVENRLATRELDQRDRRLDLDEGTLGVNQRVQDLAEQQAARGWSSEDSRGLLGLGMESGFIDPTTNEYTDSFVEAIQNGDPKAQDFAARVVGQTRPERFAEGFQPTGFDFTTVPGSVVIKGSGPNGPGVVTQGGTSDPDDPVQPIPVDSFLKQLNRDLTDLTLTGYGAQYLNLAAQKKAQGQALSREEVNRAQAEQESLDRQSVLAPLYAQGGLQAGRQLESILSGASADDSQQILKDLATDFGIQLPSVLSTKGDPTAIPTAITDEMAEAKPYSERKYGREVTEQVESVFDVNYGPFTNGIRNKDRRIKQLSKQADGETNPSKRARLEDQIATLQGERDQQARDLNAKIFGDVETEIKKIQDKLASAPEGRKDYWRDKLTEAQGERDRLISQGVRTPAMESEGWAQLEKDVLSRIRGLSPEEVDRLVDEGKLQFTAETTAALRQRAAEVGITKIADIKKLPTEEELAYRAITSVFAPDATTRENARREIDNLITTGDVSTSTSDRMRNETDRMTAESTFMRAQASLAETQRMLDKDADAQVTAANSYAQGWLKNVNDGLANGNADEVVKANFPSMVQEFNKYRGNRLALKDLYTATNAGLSRVFASYADRGLGNKVVDKFVSLFNPNTSDDPTDFKLERIRIDPGDTGPPRFLTYVGPTGRPQGEKVSITALKNQIGEEAVNVLVAAAKANAEAN